MSSKILVFLRYFPVLGYVGHDVPVSVRGTSALFDSPLTHGVIETPQGDILYEGPRVTVPLEGPATVRISNLT
jgi:hypothetical protein